MKRLWLLYGEGDYWWSTPWSLGTHLWAWLHGYHVELVWGV